MNHSLEILLLFSLFVVKHFICDFILQSDRMTKEKGTYGADGGRDHATIHALGTMVVLLLVFHWSVVNIIVVVILGLLDGIIHYHIDWIKSKINTQFNLYPEQGKQFWWLLGADQMMHYLTYLLIIAIIIIL